MWQDVSRPKKSEESFVFSVRHCLNVCESERRIPRNLSHSRLQLLSAGPGPIIYPSKPAAAPVSASCWWLAARLTASCRQPCRLGPEATQKQVRLTCFWVASGPRRQGWRQLDMVTWLQHKPRIGLWENHGKSAFSPHLQALHPSLLLCALTRFHWKRLLVCLNGFVWPKSNSLSYLFPIQMKTLIWPSQLEGSVGPHSEILDKPKF